MAEYGVIPTGFNRKELAQILADIEALNVSEFGPRVIQTPQSPLGQLNGLFADYVAQLWELGEDIYQSFDVDQAEGTRLETLAKFRLLRRGVGETEGDFRRAVTNQGESRVDVQDISRAVRSVEGVTYSQVFVNDSNEMDGNRLPPGTICVAVLGGDADDLAYVVRRFVVPGISTYGNTYVSTTIDGFCRSVAILRPILVPVNLEIKIRTGLDNYGCPPPNPTVIRDQLVAALTNGENRLINGDNITHFRLRQTIESMFPNVEVVSFIGSRDGIAGAYNNPVDIGFIELATLSTTTTNVDAI